MSRASKLGFSLGSPLGATGAAGVTGVTVQALGAGAASCWGQAAAVLSIVAVGLVTCSAGGIALAKSSAPKTASRSSLGFSLGSPLGSTGAAGATVQALGAGAASCWGQAAAAAGAPSIVAVGRVSCSAGIALDKPTGTARAHGQAAATIQVAGVLVTQNAVEAVVEYSSNSSVRVTQNAVEAVLESYPGLVGSTSCSGRAAAHLYVTAQGRTGAGGKAGRATYASAVGRVGILGLDPVTNVRKIGGTGLAAASGQIRAAGFRSAATGGSSPWGMAVAVCSFNARAIGRAQGSGAATRCAIFAFAIGRTSSFAAGLIGLNASATPGAGDTLSPSVGGISNKAF
jgi:hypothetical protein